MQPRIMVVEDEEALGTLLSYNLEAEGYDVEVIPRGDEADIRLQERVPAGQVEAAAAPRGVDQDVGVDEQGGSAPVVGVEVLAAQRDAIVPGLIVDWELERRRCPGGGRHVERGGVVAGRHGRHYLAGDAALLIDVEADVTVRVELDLEPVLERN